MPQTTDSPPGGLPSSEGLALQMNRDRPTAVHLFSGTFARQGSLGAILRSAGWHAVDVDTVNTKVLGQRASDLMSCSLWDELVEHISAGNIDFVGAGPPCSTFSRARGHGPGPRAIRSQEHPYGLPKETLTPKEKE